MQRSPPILVLSYDIGTVLGKDSGNIDITILRRRMQQYTRPCPGLSCRDEKPSEIHKTILRRPVQRRTPALVLGGHVGAALDEELRAICII
jgi:hypothetical protein